MIDSHCHLNFHRFENDVDEVIKDSLENGISLIVNVGTKIDSSRQAVEFAEKYDKLYAVVGVHPHHADKIENSKYEARNTKQRRDEKGSHRDSNGNEKISSFSSQNDDGWLEELEELAKHPKVIGIGEIGMDFFSYQSNGIVDPKIQEKVFRQQIELSIKLGLPLQIHNRQAGKEVLRILNDYKKDLKIPPGVFHCFAGDIEILKGALDLGFYIGFDGNSTYPGLAPGETVELREIALQTPLDRILVETDSPYLTPIPLRGQRNTPKNAIITARFIAHLKSVDYPDFDSQIETNFFTVFGVR